MLDNPENPAEVEKVMVNGKVGYKVTKLPGESYESMCRRVSAVSGESFDCLSDPWAKADLLARTQARVI